MPNTATNAGPRSTFLMFPSSLHGLNGLARPSKAVEVQAQGHTQWICQTIRKKRFIVLNRWEWLDEYRK
jgi:hypothetical protein